MPEPGGGRSRWRLELIRCRSGERADFEVEACDTKGRLALPPERGRRGVVESERRTRSRLTV
jgi:protein ImuA